MQNLIKQVAKDKTDNQNKDTLRRMKEKASRINAINHEKRLKDENINMEKFERETLLNSQIRNDQVYAQR